jgi:hypothetical protein
MNIENFTSTKVCVWIEMSEIEIIKSAIRETNEALANWEFETRMGCSRNALNDVADQLNAVINSVNGHAALDD